MNDDADTPPEPSKLTRTKQLWARQGRFLTGKAARPESQRLPPGQHLVRDWPVLDLGHQPAIAPERWRLDIAGLVAHPASWSWTDFLAQPRSRHRSDIHCVTTWSRYDNDWEGVATPDLLRAVQPLDTADAVMLYSYDGYTTNLTLADFATEGAILAHLWQGRPLAREHGGPVRLVVPHLYFWKSAKWLRRIEFTMQDRPGFWEERGYHLRGDPWAEQRYSEDGS